jgi:hypothetical protein
MSLRPPVFAEQNRHTIIREKRFATGDNSSIVGYTGLTFHPLHKS